MKENSRKDIQKVDKLIKKCDECKLNECINCEISWTEVVSIKKITDEYKKVLKINEVLLKENEEIKIKNSAIKRESEAYAENMIRLDNELNLEKEKSKYEWIRQNCLPQELVNKLYIPIQKVKNKIEKLKMSGGSDGKDNTENTARELAIEALQDILEESEG